MIVDLNLCKNRNVCTQSGNFENSLERAFDLNVLQVIDIQIPYVFLIFQNFSSYRTIRNLQIATDCSVLTDSVFRVLFAYFDEPMPSIGGYEP